MFIRQGSSRIHTGYHCSASATTTTTTTTAQYTTVASYHLSEYTRVRVLLADTAHKYQVSVRVGVVLLHIASRSVQVWLF